MWELFLSHSDNFNQKGIICLKMSNIETTFSAFVFLIISERWVRIPLRQCVLDTTLYDSVCQWVAWIGYCNLHLQRVQQRQPCTSYFTLGVVTCCLMYRGRNNIHQTRATRMYKWLISLGAVEPNSSETRPNFYILMSLVDQFIWKIKIWNKRLAKTL